MLSKQLQQDKKRAEERFAAEKAKKIPKKAFNRTFKDPNHKPEIMYSLSTFYLLHAFRPDAEIITLMEMKESLHLVAEEIRQKGRSEERRVGKEGRARRRREQKTK